MIAGSAKIGGIGSLYRAGFQVSHERVDRCTIVNYFRLFFFPPPL